MSGSSDLVVIALEQSVAALDRGRVALAEAETIRDVKAIVDMAAAAELYARRQQLGDEAERYARELKLDAERKLGMMLKASERARAGRPPSEIGTEAEPILDRGAPTLADLGIDKKVSHRKNQLQTSIGFLLPEREGYRIATQVYRPECGSQINDILLRSAEDRMAAKTQMAALLKAMRCDPGQFDLFPNEQRGT